MAGSSVVSASDKRSPRRHRGKPEGPYETGDSHPTFGISNHELARLLDFIEQFDHEIEQTLTIRSGSGEMRMLVALLRDHLTGKLTTSSSLVAHSGLTYGTAMRTIASLIEQELIVKRPRTATGKSYSLHPTEKMLREWQELARRSDSLVATVFGARSTASPNLSDYFFGASYASSSVLPPPCIFATKLPIKNALRVLVHADPTFMAMHVLKKQFETVFGVGIRSRALSIDRLHEEILDNAGAGSSRYDLIACDLPWFGEMAAAGHLLPLDGLMKESKFDSSDFHREAMASARYADKQYGIPVQTTPELLVCRRDFLQEKGIAPPRTIDETIRAAHKLHDPFSGAAGIAWNAARGTPLGHSFMFVMGAFGQPILDLKRTPTGFDGENVSGENFRPMFDSDAARNTAEYFLELLDVSPRGILDMSWYERARCYADGGAALAYCATLLAPLFELDQQSPAYGQTDYLPHPFGPSGTSIAPIGGYALAIPSNIAAERVDPAWTALVSLTSAQAIKLYIENGSLVTPRFSVGMDPAVKRISPLISIVDEMARSGVLQMWPRPPVPEIAEIIEITGEEMHDMLLGAKSIGLALETAQNRADALMRSHGHY
ncbi:MAG: extracellular solute-binding protein [Alphaproteobacteria bacterium]|nr:extracellular solute-binding protein [Alphaproteobacteria bacterium]